MALLCCVITVAAFGQGVNLTSGSITGHITDSTGAALPGVTVTATNAETGLNRNAVTDSTGEYRFNLLPPGRYRVDAELAGLGKASSPAVTVLLGNDTKADLKIAPQVAESITVSAVAPIIDTQRTGMAASVTNQQIENLPLLGRDFRSLAALTPGVSAGSFDTASITANGARPLSTDFNIDGASSNNDFFGQQTGGTRAPFTFSQAAIKEFQVIRTQYDAGVRPRRRRRRSTPSPRAARTTSTARCSTSTARSRGRRHVRSYSTPTSTARRTRSPSPTASWPRIPRSPGLPSADRSCATSSSTS